MRFHHVPQPFRSQLKGSLRASFREQDFKRSYRQLRRRGMSKVLASSAAWHSAFPTKGLADDGGN